MLEAVSLADLVLAASCLGIPSGIRAGIFFGIPERIRLHADFGSYPGTGLPLFVSH
jgi:hypothetical protein